MNTILDQNDRVFDMNRNAKSAFSIGLALSGLLCMIGVGSPSPVSAADVDPAYRASFEKWKAEEVDDLKQNWLPLAGLFWLKPGVNRFGSDPNNDIVLPRGSAPAQAGTFEFSGEQVTIKFRPGVSATIGGQARDSAQLQPDTSGTPTVVELGRLRMHVIKRVQRTGIRVKDLNSAAARNYRGPIFFDLNPAYKVTATWVPSHGKRTVDVPNVLGDTTPTAVAGEVRFTLNGQDVQLTDLGGDPSKGLFVVFNDLTSKTDTYPGGRFLETDPVTNGTVVLDFNRAHNPPCAVTPYATCPLAPKENRLAIAIPAGEKYDRTHGHH
jgi:uncharacterized protein (DUF1684 family)